LSVGIHIATIFALKPGEALTSEFIACSVNTNPVVIRRLLGSLREAGIVESRIGAGGGWSLLRDPEELTLLDILRAVEPQNEMFALHRSEPNPECPCGLHIQSVLTEVYDKVEQGMTAQLASINIACIAAKIVKRVSEADLLIGQVTAERRSQTTTPAIQGTSIKATKAPSTTIPRIPRDQKTYQTREMGKNTATKNPKS
jgi:Rrf2 family protein